MGWTYRTTTTKDNTAAEIWTFREKGEIARKCVRFPKRNPRIQVVINNDAPDTFVENRSYKKLLKHNTIEFDTDNPHTGESSFHSYLITITYTEARRLEKGRKKHKKRKKK